MSQWHSGLREGPTLAEKEFLRRSQEGDGDVSQLMSEIHRQKESKHSREFRLKEQAMAIVRKYQGKGVTQFKRPPRVLLREAGDTATVAKWKKQQDGASVHQRLEEKRRKTKEREARVEARMKQRQDARHHASRQRTRNATLRVAIAARMAATALPAGPEVLPGVPAWMVLSRCLSGTIPPPLQPPPLPLNQANTPDQCPAALLPTLLLLEANQEYYTVLVHGRMGQVETLVHQAAPSILKQYDTALRQWQRTLDVDKRDTMPTPLVCRLPITRPYSSKKNDTRMIVTSDASLVISCSEALAKAKAQRGVEEPPPSPQRRTPHSAKEEGKAPLDAAKLPLQEALLASAMSPGAASFAGIWAGNAIATVQPYVPSSGTYPWLVRTMVSRRTKDAKDRSKPQRPYSAASRGSTDTKSSHSHGVPERVELLLESTLAAGTRSHARQASPILKSPNKGNAGSDAFPLEMEMKEGEGELRNVRDWQVHIGADGVGTLLVPLSVHAVHSELGALYRVKRSFWPVQQRGFPLHDVASASTFPAATTTVPPQDLAAVKEGGEPFTSLLVSPKEAEWGTRAALGPESATKPLMPFERASLWMLDAMQDWTGCTIDNFASDWMYSNTIGWVLLGIKLLQPVAKGATALYQGDAWRSAQKILGSPTVSKAMRRSWSARQTKKESKGAGRAATTLRGSTSDMHLLDVEEEEEKGQRPSSGLGPNRSRTTPSLPPLLSSRSRAASVAELSRSGSHGKPSLGLLESRSEGDVLPSGAPSHGATEEKEADLKWWWEGEEPPPPRESQAASGALGLPRSPSPLRSPTKQSSTGGPRQAKRSGDSTAPDVLAQRIPPSVDAATLRSKYSELSQVMEKMFGKVEKRRSKVVRRSRSQHLVGAGPETSTAATAQSPPGQQGSTNAPHQTTTAEVSPQEQEAKAGSAAASVPVRSMPSNSFAMELLRRTQERSVESLLFPSRASARSGPAPPLGDESEDDEKLSKLLGLPSGHSHRPGGRDDTQTPPSTTPATSPHRTQKTATATTAQPLDVYDIMLQTASARHRKRLAEVKSELKATVGPAQQSRNSLDGMSSEGSVEVYPGVSGLGTGSSYGGNSDNDEEGSVSSASGVKIKGGTVAKISRKKQQRSVERLAQPSRHRAAADAAEGSLRSEGSSATITSATAEAVTDVLRQAKSIYSTPLTQRRKVGGIGPKTPGTNHGLHTPGSAAPPVVVASSAALLRRRQDPLTVPKLGTDDLPKVKKPEAVLKAKPRVQSYAAPPKKRRKKKKKVKASESAEEGARQATHGQPGQQGMEGDDEGGQQAVEGSFPRSLSPIQSPGGQSRGVLPLHHEEHVMSQLDAIQETSGEGDAGGDEDSSDSEGSGGSWETSLSDDEQQEAGDNDTALDALERGLSQDHDEGVAYRVAAVGDTSVAEGSGGGDNDDDEDESEDDEGDGDDDDNDDEDEDDEESDSGAGTAGPGAMFQSKLQSRMRRQLRLDILDANPSSSAAAPPSTASEEPSAVVYHTPRSPLSAASSPRSVMRSDNGSLPTASPPSNLYMSPGSPSMTSSTSSAFFHGH